MNRVILQDRYRWINQVSRPEHIAQYRFIKLKRMCEEWRSKNKLIFLFYRVIYEYYKVKYNTDIPANCKIGPGFKIRHLGGIVFNPEVVVGSNVDCLNGVLLGQIDTGCKAGSPTIGNNVFIGTNAAIVGKITIGDNVIIAPNAYVNFDVPNNSIVIGNPGKIHYKENATEGVIDNPIEMGVSHKDESYNYNYHV